jgi:hypothetical protein
MVDGVRVCSSLKTIVFHFDNHQSITLELLNNIVMLDLYSFSSSLLLGIEVYGMSKYYYSVSLGLEIDSVENFCH